MRPFALFSARNSQEAVSLLAAHGPSVKVLAGGTDLLVDLKTAADVPKVIIDISRASDLAHIALTDHGLSIGAMATHTAIMRSPLVRDGAPVLIEAAHAIGAVQTRNLGTLGGNLVTGVPSMDGGPPLFALDALLVLLGSHGRRELPIAEFFVGPRRTALRPDELLAEILVPNRNLEKPAAFQKFGLRKGQALALVNVAASTRLDRDCHVFVEPRIALGAVAPVVMRALEAEAYLEHRAVSPEAMEEAGRIASAEVQPISDFRASAQYRRHLVAVLTQRALAAACARARSGPDRRAA